MTKYPVRPLLHSVMERAAHFLVPLQVTMELSYRCNLACKHCYIDEPSEKELSLTEIKSVLDQLAEAGSLYLLFSGGEPLIRHDFFEIATYANERGFLVMFLTNGTLITPQIARQIHRLQPVFVGMTLHGATPGIHDTITRRRGSFASTIQAIKLLKGLGVTVSLQTLLMDSNVRDAKAMKSLAEWLGVQLRIGYEFVPGRSGSLAPYQYEISPREFYDHYEYDPAGGNLSTFEVDGVCKAGKGICSISPSGDVFPCLLMPMKVGNLRQNNFIDIWQNNPDLELTRLRSLTWQDLSSCKDCSLAKYCKRCIGVAFTETRELTKPAPSACRYAALKSEFFKRKGVIA